MERPFGCRWTRDAPGPIPADEPSIAAALKAAGSKLSDALTAIEQEIYQVKNQSGQDPLNFPIKLNNKLAALQGVVESGYGKPTDQSYAVFKDLSARLDDQFAKLGTVLKAEFAAFNREMQKRKMDLVK